MGLCNTCLTTQKIDHFRQHITCSTLSLFFSEWPASRDCKQRKCSQPGIQHGSSYHKRLVKGQGDRSRFGCRLWPYQGILKGSLWCKTLRLLVCLCLYCFLFIIPYSDRKGFVPTLNLTVITSNSSTSSYPSALPTIQVHLELDGRTLEIVHCFYNVVRHFFFSR